jgi:16S rRNA (guanine966-N2)-methyltransferase
MAKRKGPAKKNSRPGRLRIVAGKWRSRLLPVVDIDGLRPTSERIRETLFNWLAGEITDSHCLDPFAGTGALAFEAMSRGAASAMLIDNSRRVVESLINSAELLNADNARILCADGLSFMQQKASRRYDIVFLDPPFAEDIVEDCCRLLQSNGWLTDHAAVYIEQAKGRPQPELPPGWTLVKDNKAGNVRYMLARPD